MIPESRKKPLTNSLLYKQIVRFLEQEKIAEKFEIAFISIEDGIVSPACHSEACLTGRQGAERPKNPLILPPKHFRSGRLWITKKQIEQMADSIVSYLSLRAKSACPPLAGSNPIVIAYCRGAYLEAVRLANKKLLITNYQLQITEIFSDDELAQLKKKGIMWMKVGLRTPTAFIIFRMKMKFLVMDNENKQLKLF